MKHKMNFLCGVIFIFTILMPVANLSSLFFTSEGELKLSQMDIYPTHISNDNSFRLKDAKTNKEVKAWAKSVMVEEDLNVKKNKSVWFYVALMPVPIIGLVTWFLFFFYFIKFVIAINKGEVFSWKTISLLRKAGWASLISEMVGLILLLFANGSRVFVGYANDYSRLLEEIPGLLCGLLLLLMAQTFSIGLKQKEELEQVI